MKQKRKKAFASVSVKSFISVVALLMCVLIFAGAMSYFIPSGSYERDGNGYIIDGTYTEEGIKGLSVIKILTAPVRVFFSSDALTVIMISLFLLIMSGTFNILEKTGGIRTVIRKIISSLNGRTSLVICVSVFIFMLFGSLFGMFEELVALLPIMIMFMLSMGLDSMSGLGVCMLAACFGFSAAITNPFSVGLASQIAGVSALDGVWMRLLFFGLVYFVVVGFLLIHVRKIKNDPKKSITYESDLKKRADIELNAEEAEDDPRKFKIFCAFFIVQAAVIVLIASVSAISSYAIVILAASFLITGIVTGLLVCERKGETFVHFFNGAAAMFPAVVMLAIASSVKLVMSESGIIDTIMKFVIENLEGKSKFVTVILIYVLILFLQMFIGSASAKILLVMPIILPICQSLDISASTVILVYCIADGFTDMIIPTNAVLIVGLSMADVSYGKWFRWTWKLQIIMLALTAAVLYFATSIGY